MTNNGNAKILTSKEKSKKRNILFLSVILFIIIVIIGTLGYRLLFGLSFLDSLYNAILIISTLELEGTSRTVPQKIFIMIYTLLAGILFISIATHAVEQLIDLYEARKLPI